MMKLSARAKLSMRQARRIRLLRKQGWTQAKLAERFRVSQSAVYMLVSGKTYKDAA